MGRVLVGLCGVVLALYPERVRELYERIAFERPDERAAKPSSGLATRIEGLVFVAASLAGGKAYAWLMVLLGAAGALALLVPRWSLELSNAIVYRQPEAVEWKDGFVTVVRCFGALYLVLALDAFRGRRADDRSRSSAHLLAGGIRHSRIRVACPVISRTPIGPIGPIGVRAAGRNLQ